MIYSPGKGTTSLFISHAVYGNGICSRGQCTVRKTRAHYRLCRTDRKRRYFSVVVSKEQKDRCSILRFCGTRELEKLFHRRETRPRSWNEGRTSIVCTVQPLRLRPRIPMTPGILQRKKGKEHGGWCVHRAARRRSAFSRVVAKRAADLTFKAAGI